MKYDSRVVGGREVLLEKYRVVLADDSELTVSQGAEREEKFSFGLHRLKELQELTKSKQGRDIGEEEREVMGKKWLFHKKLYILSDGTEVIESRAGSMDSLD